jgi:hypothetical protein
LYFASDLVPAVQRGWLRLSANCYCGDRLPLEAANVGFHFGRQSVGSTVFAFLRTWYMK